MKSLDFSQNEMNELRKEMSDLKTSDRNNSSLSKTLVQFSERLRIFEDISKNKNMRITGMSAVGNENSDQSITLVQKPLRKVRVDNVQFGEQNTFAV